MAISSPSAWTNLTRVNVSLEAITGSPGIAAAPSGAFGRSANVRSLNANTDRNALFLTGETTAGAGTAASARQLFAALGVAPESATRRTNVRAASITGSRAGTSIVLQQQVEGHDVVGANVKVNVAPSGAFVVTGRPIGDLAGRTPLQPASAKPEQASATAAALFDVEASAVRETKLLVFPTADGSARWAYRVSLLIEDPCADVRAYIDARDLNLLLSFNIASALRGRASIFPVDPKRSPALVDVSLADLGPTPADQLAGGRLIVTTGRPPGLARGDRDFRLTDADAGFDEANAFYHLRGALRYFGGLRGRRRFPSPPFRPIRAIVRDPASSGNAFFRPIKNDLSFGDVQGRPTARSADVLYHEFTHAVSHFAARLGNSLQDSQTRGLNEGFSDYFAATVLDDPHFAVWVAPGGARDASDPTLRFPPGFVGSEHDTGAVWAAVLWGIRAKAGAKDTDRIVFESLFLLSEQSTFEDALRALVSADALLVSSGQMAKSHASTIRAEFQKRR